MTSNEGYPGTAYAEENRERDRKLEAMVRRGYHINRAAEIIDGKEPGAYRPRAAEGGGTKKVYGSPRTCKDPRPRGNH